MINQKKLFFPNLDALRFFCFLSVFLFHSFFTKYEYLKNTSTYYFFKKSLFGNGNLGVNFFFVLSGFLITYLLIEEKLSKKKIDVVNFWIRRILRIWPLFFFCVIFGFIIFPVVKTYFGQTPNENADPVYYLTFTNNFDFIRKGLPDSSVLGVLWSIAIEEQFYLIWPVILLILPVKHYMKFFFITILISLIFRALYPDPMFYEHHTLSCMGDLTIGAAGAYLSRQPKFLSKIEHLNRFSIILIYASFFIVFFFREEFFDTGYYIKIFDRVIIACIMLLIILEQNFSKNSFYKMSNFKIASKLGVISYGLYCLHFIGILITITISEKLHINESLWSVLLIEPIAAIVITIILSKLSYRFFESPFLRLKEKFAYIIK
jgi:peptidoglycan/LPS O-acetylase OafA/YrhL